MIAPEIYLWIAAAICAAAVYVHAFPAWTKTLAPLMDSNAPPLPKDSNYYCWHMVTITLAFMGIWFGLAALRTEYLLLAAAATGLAAAFSVWSLVMIRVIAPRKFLLPQWYVFVPMTILGILGIS